MSYLTYRARSSHSHGTPPNSNPNSSTSRLASVTPSYGKSSHPSTSGSDSRKSRSFSRSGMASAFSHSHRCATVSSGSSKTTLPHHEFAGSHRLATLGHRRHRLAGIGSKRLSPSG